MSEPNPARAEPAARFDDRTAPHGWVLEGPLDIGVATELAGVRAEIDRAERAAANGAWVAMVVAYEAAPAFDTAMKVKPSAGGVPLVWWRSFERRVPAPPLPAMPSQVTDRHRAGNVLPYPDAVRAVRAAIERGDVYQVNVTDRFHGTFSGSAFDLYCGLVGVQTCRYGAFVDLGGTAGDPAGDRVVVSASPELFFEWDGEVITCRPMKGTAPRLARPADDAAQAARLAASPKERAENVMIVDLLRNDVSRVAQLGTVAVPDLFRLERYETVWQLTSTVTARTRPGGAATLADVFAALFPCGSVTGAPKVSAMAIIDALENEPRGVYCGAVGLLAPPGADAPRARFAVPIRTAVVDPSTSSFVYGAGGGITWSSDPAAEDDEVRAKARILTRSHRTFELFETMRQNPSRSGETGGAMVGNVAAHLQRMAASAEWFGFPFDADEAAAMVAAVPAVDVPHRLRVRSNEHGRIEIDQVPLDMPLDMSPDAPPGAPPVAVRLAIDIAVTASDDPFCCHKTTWRAHYDAARARHPAADDVVLVNENGQAIETTIANLAYRLGDRWYTPPLSDGGLPGIARQRLVDDGTLTERSILASELAACDELAVVNDLRGRRRAVLLTVNLAGAARIDL